MNPIATAPSRQRPRAVVATTPRCVLDIEASGFGRGSYPVEIGWALPDSSARCMLVRPVPGWTHWDAAAELLHGITRETLERHGHDAVEVALRMNAELGGHTVYCDAWGQDYSWLAMLFEAVALTPAFRLEAASRLFGDTLLAQLDMAHRRAFTELQVQRHRASNDARALQRAVQQLESRRR